MDFVKINLNQFLALIPANLLSICGGFHLAYGIFNTNLGLKNWMGDHSLPAISMIIISFHIMAFLGAVHGCFLYKKFHIYKLHLTAAVPMLCGGVIFFMFEDIYYAILSSRILTGFAYGCANVSSIFYIAEISSPEIRAHLVLLNHLCLTFGMFLHAISHPFNALFGIGISCVVLTCLTFPIGYYTMKESHVFLMLNNRTGTLERLYYFQGFKELEHDAMQSYLIHEEQRKFKFCGRHNMLTLLIIIMVQTTYLFTSNGLHNYLRLAFMKPFLMEFTETWALTSRIFGICTSLAVLNVFAKKFQFSIPSLLISTILIAFGALFLFPTQLWTPVPFFIIIEFLFGLGMCGISEMLKSELFPMKERPFSVAVTYFLEEGLQIVSVIIMYSWLMGLGSNPSYWPFIFSGLSMICGIFVMFILRDSRKQEIYDACMLYKD